MQFKQAFLCFFIAMITALSPLFGGLELTVAQRSGTTGAVLIVPLTLSNDTSAVGLMCDISFDSSKLILDPLAVTSLQSTHEVLAALPGPGLLRLIFNPKEAPFMPLANGPVAQLTVVIGAATAIGDYPLTVTSLQVSDDLGLTVSATMSTAGAINVRAANLPPQAQVGSLMLVEDSPASALLGGSDGDGDPLIFAVDSQPGKGLLVLTDTAIGAFTYVPYLNEEGSDGFSFTVSDGMALSAAALFSLQIDGRNDAPSETSALIVTDEDSIGSAQPLVSDVDALDSFSFEIVTQALHGTGSVDGGNLIYEPQENYSGSDSLVFRATDSGLAAVEGTALVTVTPVNDPPLSASASYDLDEDSSQSVTPTVIDVDDTSFLFSLVTPPEFGSVSITGDAVVYTPHENYNGPDQFVFRATDGGFAQIQATAFVDVHPLNDPPSAAQARLEVCLDLESVGVTPDVEDVDISLEGDSFTFTVLSQGAHGNAAEVDNKLVYTPDSGYTGSDSFSFRSMDEAGAFVDADAMVTVSLFSEVSASGGRAQGLAPLTFSAGANCGISGINFQWVDDLGVVLESGPIFLLDPAPAATAAYELVGVDDATLSEQRKTFVVLVHPAGVDLNGDGQNTLTDLLLAAPLWNGANTPYEADGDGRLSVLDLLFINTDGS